MSVSVHPICSWRSTDSNIGITEGSEAGSALAEHTVYKANIRKLVVTLDQLFCVSPTHLKGLLLWGLCRGKSIVCHLELFIKSNKYGLKM